MTVAVAAQSMWETGLVMPANAALCAVVAAIAVHRPDGDREPDYGRAGDAAIRINPRVRS